MCIEHVQDSLRLKDELLTLQVLFEGFNELTRRLPGLSALPTVAALANETQLLLMEQTGANAGIVYLKRAGGSEGLKVAADEELETVAEATASVPASHVRSPTKLRKQTSATCRMITEPMREEASKVERGYTLKSRRRAMEQINVANTIDGALVSVAKTEVNDANIATYQMLTVPVLMPPRSATPQKHADSRKGPAAGPALEEDASGGDDPWLPGECIGVIQLAGRLKPLQFDDFVAGTGPTNPCNSRRSRESREASFRRKGPKMAFEPEDEHKLRSVAAAFATLLPILRAKERQQARLARAQAAAAAYARQQTLFARLLDSSHAFPPSVEALFATARNFADYVPASACHLFLVGNANTEAPTPAGYGGFARDSNSMGALATPTPQRGLKQYGMAVLASVRMGDKGQEGPPADRGLQELWTQLPGEDNDDTDASTPAPRLNSLQVSVSGSMHHLGPRRVAVRLGAGVLGACVVGGKPILLEEANVDQRFEPSIDECASALPTANGTHKGASLACVPLIDQFGAAIGVLQAVGLEDMPLNDANVETMRMLAHLLACNLLLLRRQEGKPVGEQVSMQRVTAALQEEARALKEEILHQRRVMYQGSIQPLADGAPTSAPTNEGRPSATEAVINAFTKQPTSASPPPPPDVGAARKANAKVSGTLKNSTSLPVVSRAGAASGRGSPVGEGPSAAPKSKRVGFNASPEGLAAGRTTSILAAKPIVGSGTNGVHEATVCGSPDAARSRVSAPRFIVAKASARDVDAAPSAVSDADRHANPRGRMPVLHPVLDRKSTNKDYSPVAPAVVEGAPPAPKERASRVGTARVVSALESEEAGEASGGPRGEGWGECERPKVGLGLVDGTIGHIVHNAAERSEQRRAADASSKARRAAMARGRVASSLAPSERPSPQGKETDSPEKLAEEHRVGVNSVWDELLRTVRDL